MKDFKEAERFLSMVDLPMYQALKDRLYRNIEGKKTGETVEEN